jgi:predicted metal-dependent hydrolase
LAPESCQLEINGLRVEVVRKKIKNLHLRVYAPAGQVRVTVPFRVSDRAVRQLVMAKFDWIKGKQAEISARPQPRSRKMVSGETLDFLGQAYRLNIIEHQGAARVELTDQSLDLYVRPTTGVARRAVLLDQWYRRQLKSWIPQLLTRWQPIIGVQVADWGVKKMKTRWGSCNIRARRIWLNLELAKKPFACVEYVLVHELVHLLEPSHNARFKQLMHQFLPQGALLKARLKGDIVTDENRLD